MYTYHVCGPAATTATATTTTAAAAEKRAYARSIGETSAERRTTGRTRKIPGKADEPGRTGGLGTAPAPVGSLAVGRRIGWSANDAGQSSPTHRGPPAAGVVRPSGRCAARTWQVRRGKWLHTSGWDGGRAVGLAARKNVVRAENGSCRRRYI